MDFTLLFLHIMVPILLPALILMIGAGDSIRSRLSALFSLKSAESLIAQRLFWLSILIPVILFISFGTICWSGYQLNLSKEGIDEFLKISSLPLALLSASIPLGIVVASFHSTQQTGEQIRNTQHKNNLDSYYSHRNEFFTHFSRHHETSYFGVLTGKFKPHPLLYYKCVVGTPEKGTPELNKNYFENIENDFDTAARYLHCIIGYEYDDLMPDQYLYYACPAISRLASDMGLTEISSDLAEGSITLTAPPEYIKIAGPQIITIGTTTNEIIAALRYARDFYTTLCVFHGYNYEPLFRPFEYLISGNELFKKPGYKNIKTINTNLYNISTPPQTTNIKKPAEPSVKTPKKTLTTWLSLLNSFRDRLRIFLQK